jgi:hypothetical protein
MKTSMLKKLIRRNLTDTRSLVRAFYDGLRPDPLPPPPKPVRPRPRLGLVVTFLSVISAYQGVYGGAGLL